MCCPTTFCARCRRRSHSWRPFFSLTCLRAGSGTLTRLPGALRRSHSHLPGEQWHKARLVSLSIAPSSVSATTVRITLCTLTRITPLSVSGSHFARGSLVVTFLLILSLSQRFTDPTLTFVKDHLYLTCVIQRVFYFPFLLSDPWSFSTFS